MYNVTLEDLSIYKSTTWRFKKFKDAVEFLNVMRKTNKGYFCLWFVND